MEIKKRNQNNLEEGLLSIPQKPSRVNTNSTQFNTHIIKIWEDISTPNDWAEELDVITFSSELDTIILDICSDGGILDTAMLFHRALKNTEARTVAIIGSSCASAASIIALSCNEWVVDGISSLMAHTSSYMIGGKDTDILEHASFSRKQLLTFYEEVYTGFLTKEELGDVIKGTPFYFDSEDLHKRLNNLTKYKGSLDKVDTTKDKDLGDCTKEELHLICESLNINFKTKDNKNKLIDLINNS